MKKITTLLFLIVISAYAAWAQPGRNSAAWERIHAAKMTYVTDRLQLTAEQSGKFVPLYNEYENELRGIRQAYFKKYKANNPEPANAADSAAARQFVDDDLDYQQQIIGLKRKYNDRFLKVITPGQLADLYTAEREFRQLLMKRLDNHKGERRK